MLDRVDALKTLIASEGWQAFRAHAESQWSDSFVLSRITNALSGIAPGDELSQQETTRNLIAARSAVLDVLQWPEREIESLSRNQTPTGHQSPVQRFMKAVGR